MAAFSHCKCFPVGLKAARKNRSEPVGFWMSCLTLAFLHISTSCLSLSRVKTQTQHLSGLLFISESCSSECTFADLLGQCWAHQSCALWSEGVCRGEGQSLLNVDRAIYSGSTKVSQASRSWANGRSHHGNVPQQHEARLHQAMGS